MFTNESSLSKKDKDNGICHSVFDSQILISSCCLPGTVLFPGVVQSLSRVRLFATPWTVAHQAPLSWDSPGNNTGVGCHFLLQLFPVGNTKVSVVGPELERKGEVSTVHGALSLIYLAPCSGPFHDIS